MNTLRLSLACSAALTALAQTGALTAPRLGFVFDKSAGTVRTLSGIPGAATLGQPLDSGFTVRSATTAGSSAALVDGDGRVWILRAGAVPVRLEGAIISPDTVSFSPSGETLLLGSRELHRLQIYKGTDLVRELTVAARMSAVSDDGDVVLAAEEDDSSAVQAIGPGGSVRLAIDHPVAAFSFRAGSRQAVLAADSGEIYTVDETYALHAGGRIEGGRPVAVYAPRSSSRVFVASAAGSIAAVDPETGTMTIAQCDCSPSGLFPLGAPLLFRLTESDDGVPVQIFDASRPQPRVWFVPAVGGVR